MKAKTSATLCLILVTYQILLLPDTNGQVRSFSNENRFAISPDSTVKVDNRAGNIHIVLSRRSDLELTVKRRPAASKAVLPEEITIEQDQAQISITVKPDKNAGSIDLRLSLPEWTHLRLVSESGNIEILGAAGSIVARTQSGNIDMSLPEGLNADIALTSVNGRVRTTRALIPVGDLDSKSVYGQLGDGGEVLVAHSKNGQVTLKTSRNEMSANRSNERSVIASSARASRVRPSIRSPQPYIVIPSQPSFSYPSDQYQSLGPQTLTPRTLAPQSLAPQTLSPQGQNQLVSPSSSKPSLSSSRPKESPSKPELKRTDKAKNSSPVDLSDSASSSASSDDENVLKIESQLVTLNALVSNDTGHPILDLKKEEFQVYEDKIPQEVSHFQTVQSPFNLVLLIDLSGSVRDKIHLIKRAALHFVESIRPEDRVGIVIFSGATRVVSPLTNDREELRRRIETINQPIGGTNFYDALDETLKLIENSVNGERNAIVIMSDGVDNALPGVPGAGSDTTFDELAEKVQESDTVIFPIYLDTESEASDQYGGMMTVAYQMARKQLQELADATGGTLYYAKRVEDLEGHYDEVAGAIRTIYSLGYYPSNSTNDGSFRRIQVQVKRNGAKIKARRGYYAKKD
jgi:VWFA-related protein